jgi:hypothetical protein
MTMTMLKDQAAAARLAIAELEKRSQDEAEQTAIATAQSRAKLAGDVIAEAMNVSDELRGLGVKVSSLPQARLKDATDCRTTLRRTATAVANPDRSLTSLLNGPSTQKALKQGEDIARSFATTLVASVERYRATLRPSDLDRPVPNLQDHMSTVLALRGVKLQLEASTPTIGGMPMADMPSQLRSLPESCRLLRAAADTWLELRPSVDSRVAALPRPVQRFLEAAAREGGAEWSLITPEVRTWLDESDHGNPYKVCLR